MGPKNTARTKDWYVGLCPTPNPNVGQSTTYVVTVLYLCNR